MSDTSGWRATDNLMTKHDVATALNIGLWRVQELRKSGKLPGVLIGRSYRFDPADVRQFITNSKS